MGETNLALLEVGKELLGGCSHTCQSEQLEGPLERISGPGAPRSGIQVNRQSVSPSEPRNFQRDPGSLDLSYRGKGIQELCARAFSFSSETGTTP